jgi:hypothetical protein
MLSRSLEKFVLEKSINYYSKKWISENKKPNYLYFLNDLGIQKNGVGELQLTDYPMSNIDNFLNEYEITSFYPNSEKTEIAEVVAKKIKKEGE